MSSSMNSSWTISRWSSNADSSLGSHGVGPHPLMLARERDAAAPSEMDCVLVVAGVHHPRRATGITHPPADRDSRCVEVAVVPEMGTRLPHLVQQSGDGGGRVAVGGHDAVRETPLSGGLHRAGILYDENARSTGHHHRMSQHRQQADVQGQRAGRSRSDQIVERRSALGRDRPDEHGQGNAVEEHSGCLPQFPPPRGAALPGGARRARRTTPALCLGRGRGKTRRDRPPTLCGWRRGVRSGRADRAGDGHSTPGVRPPRCRGRRARQR